MSSSFISTYVLSSTLSSSVMNSQVALSKASKEVTTGRMADVQLGLGALTGQDVVLRASLADLNKIVDTNGLVSGRLDATQQAITNLVSTGQQFLQQLIAASGTPDGGKILLPTAQANLQELISTLNTSLNGQYIFGGINTQVQPINDYQPGSPNKLQVDGDFSAAGPVGFGFTQTSPLVSGVTAAQMQTFLTNTFDPEFANPPVPPGPPGLWATNWSNANDQVMQSRISTSQVINSSVSANDPAFRQLAEVYTMLSQLGTDNMSQSTVQVVISKATGMVTSALSSLALMQGQVGTYQERTTTSSSKMQTQADVLTTQINSMEKVDPNAASVQVTSLQTQIETAMSLTAQLQKLSLTNYI